MRLFFGFSFFFKIIKSFVFRGVKIIFGARRIAFQDGKASWAFRSFFYKMEVY